MTQVHISVKKPSETGLVAATGTFRFSAVRRYFDTAKNLIIPASFEATLGEDGTMTVDLLPTTAAFVWKVTELPGTDSAYTRYVEVPEQTGAKPTPIEYADLVDVDPSTLAPVAMNGGDLLNVHHAASQADAEAYSAKYPDVLVFFDETASTASASEALASIASLADEAQTNSKRVRAASAQVVTDANTVTALHTSIESTAQQVTATADDATSRINAAVERVEAAADEATGANQPAVIPEA